jgi:pseudaminic acid cytidylyltransferase
MNLCIIPARKSSRRIKHKNIKKILGKPIISYAIKSALKSKCFEDVVVSTDSIKIKKISESFGAKVPSLRPKKLAKDEVGLIKVISNYLKNSKKKYDNICCIYPCAIFVDKKLILETLEAHLKSKKDYTVTINKLPIPIEKTFKLSKNKIKLFNNKNINKVSNIYKNSYYDSGQLFWGKEIALIKEKNIFSNKTLYYRLNKPMYIDVNDKQDWETLTAFVKLNKRKLT